MANTVARWLYPDGARHGLTWTDAANGTRCQRRYLHGQPLFADRSRSALKCGGTCFRTSLRLCPLLDRRGNAIAPLRPGTIVLPHVVLSERIGCHKTGT